MATRRVAKASAPATGRTPAPVPTLGDVETRYPQWAGDTDLPELLAAALDQQAQRCDVATYTTDLREAALRRVANMKASRAHTLGTISTPDYGVQYLPQRDAETDRLEGDYRLGGFA